LMPKKSPSITIDYAKCGEKGKIDPRTCYRCMRACDPAVFIIHEPVGVEQDPIDPKLWRVTAVWCSLCNKCLKCVEACPEKAITVSW
jgi:ferredoxin